MDGRGREGGREGWSSIMDLTFLLLFLGWDINQHGGIITSSSSSSYGNNQIGLLLLVGLWWLGSTDEWWELGDGE